MSTPTRTVGLLHAGEMGASLAAVLRRRGSTVLTTVAGRSEATAQRARQQGLIIVDNLADLIRRADVVFSLVLPAAAEQMAQSYCEMASLAPAGAIFVDVNSIGPETVGAMADRLQSVGVDFVDGAINGLAKNLPVSGTLFLSGKRAADVGALFGDAVRVRLLGGRIGSASAMKMLLGGMSKGICALYLELALLAQRRDMLPQMIEATAQIYPGVWALIERMLPTYAQHAGRRRDEMQHLCETILASGQEPCVIDAVQRLHETLAHESLGAADGVCELIQRLARNEFLAGALQRK